MAKVTVVFEDNPMAGLPGQSDVTLMCVPEPPLPEPASEENVEILTSAQMAALSAVAHIAGLAAETAWVVLNHGSTS